MSSYLKTLFRTSVFRVLLTLIIIMSDFDVTQAFSLRSLIPIISNNIATIVSPARYVQVGEEMTYSVSHNEAEPTVQEVLNGLQIEVPDGEGLTLNVKAYKDTEDQWSMTGNITQSIQPDSVLGLVGRWKADALSGTYDSGDYVSGWSDSSALTYLQFDGINDRINGITNVFTIDQDFSGRIVFKANQTTTEAHLFGSHADAPDRVGAFVENDRLYMQIWNGNEYIGKSTAFTDTGSWHTLIFSRDADIDTMTASLDGIVMTSDAIGIGLSNPIGIKTIIGGNTDQNKNWDGGIASFVGSGLFYLHLPLNEGTGTVATDIGGSGYNGTIVGGPIWEEKDYTLSSPAKSFGSLPDRIVASLDISGEDTDTKGLVFGDSGMKLYIAGNDTDSIYQYTLTSAYDITTASYANKSGYVGDEDTTIEGVYFKSDGTKMYVAGGTTDIISEYDLSTAWDVSTILYGTSFSVINQGAGVRGFSFNSSGDSMYMVDSVTNDAVYMYRLSIPWDISTAYYSGENYSLGVSQPRDVQFNSDGTAMYIAHDGTEPFVYKYALSTPYDITTASSSGSTDLDDHITITNIEGFIVTDNDTKAYFVSSTEGSIRQGSLDAKPQYYPAVQNELPVVRFDGLGMQSLFYDGGDSVLNFGDAQTLIFAWKPQANTDQQMYPFVYDDGSSGVYNLYYAGSVFFYKPQGGVPTTIWGNEKGFNENSIYVLRRDQGSVALFEYYNQLIPVTYNSPGTTDMLFQGIGSQSTSRSVAGDFYEILLYDRSLTREELGDVTTYLLDKWNIPGE